MIGRILGAMECFGLLFFILGVYVFLLVINLIIVERYLEKIQ